jgi:hypothetical protein
VQEYELERYSIGIDIGWVKISIRDGNEAPRPIAYMPSSQIACITLI